MFLLVPYRVDVPLYRWPIANYVILALLVVCFGIQLSMGSENAQPYVLNGWRPLGLVGHIFLHGGILHLAGNMIFLWVFGNAVCEKVGNIAYPFIFLGLCAAMAHLIFSGAPAIGASGAINGIVGMFLVWFPINEISMFYFLWFIVFIRYGLFDLSSYWVVLLWLVFDVWGAASGASGVAYWAHIGGFAAGAVLAALLTKLEWVSIYDDSERTLLDIFGLRKSWRERASAADRLQTARDIFTREPDPSFASPSARDTFPPDPAARPSPAPDQAEANAPIPIVCTCGKVLKARRELAGKKGRCPACRATFQIPDD